MPARFFRQTLLVLAALAVTASWAMAQDGKINVSEAKAGKASDEVRRVENWAMAAKLADYGRANKAPLALLAAAQIMKNTPVSETRQAKSTEGKATSDAKGGKRLATPETLLAEAREMAGNNPRLLELIEQESKMGASRQVVGGPKKHIDTVKAGTTDIYELEFKAGEKAGVVVIGDDAADLDLFIYDENGHRIGQDDDMTSRCVVEWTPKWQGKFKIKVSNQGDVSSDYLLLIP